MYPVSPQYLEALKSPHQVATHVRVVKGGQTLYSGLPIEGGSIGAGFSDDARRRLTLNVPSSFPGQNFTKREVKDLVGTEGHELHVRQGLVFYDGSIEWVPVGAFRVDSRPDVGFTGQTMTLTGVSREAYVIDDQFLHAITIQGPSATALIAQLIRETLPRAEISIETRKNARVPAFVEESDRWGAIKKIAQAISCVVYADGEGRFIIKDAPTVATQPVWEIRAGRGGVLIHPDASQSRERVRNAIVVRGESSSGDFSPLQDVVFDDLPSSRTRWGDPDAGAYGKIPEFVDNPAVTTLAQARAVGRAELAKRVGISAGMNLSTIPNVALEPGDTVLVVPDPSRTARSARIHIVDSLDFDLAAGGGFNCTTRDVRDA